MKAFSTNNFTKNLQISSFLQRCKITLHNNEATLACLKTDYANTTSTLSANVTVKLY